MPDVDATARAGFAAPIGHILFLAVFAYYWITIDPFVDLTTMGSVDPAAGDSNALNQLMTLALFGSLMVFFLFRSRGAPVFGPVWILLLLALWCTLTSITALHPDLAIKRTILIAIVACNAGVVLVLPRSERDFARLLSVIVLLVLGLCYYGVAFLPLQSIHQASEIREPMNAGLWRGLFPHKNTAAGAMVLCVFFGLFIANVRSRVLGWTIVGLATFFLAQTGGKTSMLVLPAILVMGYFVEHYAWTRLPLVLGGLAGFNLLTVGSVVFEPIRGLVSALGVDPTFTNRADIWRFALDAIAERPFVGHGLNSFWQTESLVYSGSMIETWAAAAFNGHNGYLDSAVALGLPGMVLTLVWVVLLPLRDIGRAQRRNNNPAVTRLFMRIWLYVILLGCVESVFYAGGGAVWFCLLMAIFGLRLQGSARLVPSSRRGTALMAGQPGHA